MNQVLQGFTFEIQGLVQGVYFRKYTQLEARRLGLSGWVANTRRNTVVGQVWLRTEGVHTDSPHQNPTNDKETIDIEINPKLREMRHWLSHIGSPHCSIDHASFHDLPLKHGSDLDTLYPQHTGFQIRPSYP